MRLLSLFVGALAAANQLNPQTQSSSDNSQDTGSTLHWVDSNLAPANQGRGTFLSRICRVRTAPDLFNYPQCFSAVDLGEHALPSLQKEPDFLAGGGNNENFEFLKLQGYGQTDAVYIANAYRNAGIPLNEKTLVGDFQDKNLIGKLKPWKKGTFNIVFKATYRTGEGEKDFHGVFKEEKNHEPGTWGMERLTGIEGPSFRYACRNVASYRVNRLLGWKVIPRTEFALHDGKLGYVMEFVEGVPPGYLKSWEHDITLTNVGRKLAHHQKEIEADPELSGEILDQ